MKALRVAGKVIGTVGRYTLAGALMAVCLFFNRVNYTIKCNT